MTRTIFLQTAILLLCVSTPGLAANHQRGLDARTHVERYAPWLIQDQNADALAIPSRRAKEDVQVGDQRDFWYWDLTNMPPASKQFAATCRGVGENVLLYIADDQWGSTVAQSDVDTVMAAMEQATVATLDSGIYENNLAMFGTPSDIDGNGKLILLYYQLGSYHGTQFDGYFRNEDLTGGNASNDAEVLHLDVDHFSDDYGLGIAAHEFVHLIEFNYDRDEQMWASEASAQAAMVLNGFLSDLPSVGNYFNNLYRPVTGWESGGNPTIDYAQLLLWAAFVMQELPVDFFPNLIPNSLNGIDAYDDTLATLGDPRDFHDLIGAFALTVLLDAKGPAGVGFNDFDTPALTVSRGIEPDTPTDFKVMHHTIGFARLTPPEQEGRALGLHVSFPEAAPIAFYAAAWDGAGADVRTANGAVSRADVDTTLALSLAGLDVQSMEIYLAYGVSATTDPTISVEYGYTEAPADSDVVEEMEESVAEEELDTAAEEQDAMANEEAELSSEEAVVESDIVAEAEADRQQEAATETGGGSGGDCGTSGTATLLTLLGFVMVQARRKRVSIA